LAAFHVITPARSLPTCRRTRCSDALSPRSSSSSSSGKEALVFPRASDAPQQAADPWGLRLGLCTPGGRGGSSREDAGVLAQRRDESRQRREHRGVLRCRCRCRRRRGGGRGCEGWRRRGNRGGWRQRRWGLHLYSERHMFASCGTAVPLWVLTCACVCVMAEEQGSYPANDPSHHARGQSRP